MDGNKARDELVLIQASDLGADPHRFPPFYENRSEFSQINKFFSLTLIPSLGYKLKPTTVKWSIFRKRWWVSKSRRAGK